MKYKTILPLVLACLCQTLWASSNFLESELNLKMGLSRNVHPTPETKDEFFKSHAFIFFFSSQCPYCREFAPVLIQWANEKGANILNLSFDNQPLEGIHEFIPVTTQWINDAYNGKPITYPALFVVNKSDHLLYPVAYGALSGFELEQRFKEIKLKIEAFESRRAI